MTESLAETLFGRRAVLETPRDELSSSIKGLSQVSGLVVHSPVVEAVVEVRESRVILSAAELRRTEGDEIVVIRQRWGCLPCHCRCSRGTTYAIVSWTCPPSTVSLGIRRGLSPRTRKSRSACRSVSCMSVQHTHAHTKPDRSFWLKLAENVKFCPKTVENAPILCAF